MTDRELANLVDAHSDLSMEEIAAKVPISRAGLYKRSTPGTLLQAAIKRREARRREEPNLTKVTVRLTDEQIAYLNAQGELSSEVRRCIDESREADTAH